MYRKRAPEILVKLGEIEFMGVESHRKVQMQGIDSAKDQQRLT
jgi:hypothetical protein